MPVSSGEIEMSLRMIPSGSTVSDGDGRSGAEAAAALACPAAHVTRALVSGASGLRSLAVARPRPRRSPVQSRGRRLEDESDATDARRLRSDTYAVQSESRINIGIGTRFTESARTHLNTNRVCLVRHSQNDPLVAELAVMCI